MIYDETHMEMGRYGNSNQPLRQYRVFLTKTEDAPEGLTFLVTADNPQHAARKALAAHREYKHATVNDAGPFDPVLSIEPRTL